MNRPSHFALTVTMPPLQALKGRYILKPELFKKQPYYLPGCDTYERANIDRIVAVERSKGRR